MNFPLTAPRSSTLALLLAGGAMFAGGALHGSDWQSLVANTPFGQAAASAAGATGDIEFRGVVQEEGVFFVNLYNPATKSAQWVEVNGKAPGLEVKSYDAANDRVLVNASGRSLTLSLKQAKVALLAAAPAPAAGDKPAEDNKGDRRAEIRDMIRARMEGGGGGEGAPFMRNMPPEAQAMIEEFRRRRAESRGGQGGQTTGQPAQTGGQPRN